MPRAACFDARNFQRTVDYVTLSAEAHTAYHSHRGARRVSGYVTTPLFLSSAQAIGRSNPPGSACRPPPALTPLPIFLSSPPLLPPSPPAPPPPFPFFPPVLGPPPTAATAATRQQGGRHLPPRMAPYVKISIRSAGGVGRAPTSNNGPSRFSWP